MQFARGVGGSPPQSNGDTIWTGAPIPGPGDTGKWFWWDGDEWLLTALLETDGDRIYFGAAPSTGGEVNVSNNVNPLRGKRSNAVDATLISWDSNDDVTFGSTDVDNVRFDVANGGAHIFAVNTLQRLSIASATITIGANSASLTSVVQSMGTGGAATIAIAGSTEYTFNATTFDGNQNSLTDWSFISLGTAPPASGTIRLSSASDVRVLDGSNTIIVTSFAASTINFGANDSALTSMAHRVGTGGAFTFEIAGAVEYTLNATTLDGNQNSLTDWSFAELGGGTVSGIGLVRVANGNIIVGSKTFGGADINVLSFTSSDFLSLGATGVAQMFLDAAAGGTTHIRFDANTEYSFTATTFDGQQNSLTDWSFIALGTDPADSGAVRLSNGSGNGISFEASPAGTDVQAMFLDASEVLQIYDSGYSFSSTLLTVTSGRSINFNQTAASGGMINVPQGGTIILSRNNTNDGNWDILETTGATLFVGGGGHGTVGAIRYLVQTGGTHDFHINNVSEMLLSATTLDGQQNSLTDWSFLEVGSGTKPTTGEIRLADGCEIISRNDGGSNVDLITFGVSAADRLVIGENTVIGGIDLRTAPSSLIRLLVDNTLEYSFSATAFDLAGNNITSVSDIQKAAGSIRIVNGSTARIEVNDTGLGFFAATPVAKPTVTGSRGGNAALADLLTELATLGLITDSSSA